MTTGAEKEKVTETQTSAGQPANTNRNRSQKKCRDCPYAKTRGKKHEANPLLWNVHAAKDLTFTHYMLLSVFPATLSVLSAPITYIFFIVATHIGTPHISIQPTKLRYDIVYNLALLITIIDIMIGAYMIGWGINMAAARYLLGWPKRKVVRIFIYSDIPRHWKKHYDKDNQWAYAKTAILQWAETRTKGRARYILTHGLLRWGLPAYLFLTLVPTLTGVIEPAMGYYIAEFLFSATGGTIFALAVWHLSEKQFLKHRHAAIYTGCSIAGNRDENIDISHANQQHTKTV